MADGLNKVMLFETWVQIRSQDDERRAGDLKMRLATTDSTDR
jgi:hypothetical protein